MRILMQVVTPFLAVIFILLSAQIALADPPVANSATYEIWRDVDTSAGVTDSASYTMTGIAGEVSTIDVATSTDYRLRSGYHFEVADLSIIKSASPESVAREGLLTYTLVARNNSLATATGVSITDTVPASTTFKSASDGGSEVGGVVIWNTGQNLSPGQALTRTFVVTATGGTTVTNKGYVSATNVSASQASNTVETNVHQDTDGISDSVEDDAPNNGDGNDDDTLDKQQDHVASLPNAKNGSYVTLVGPAGSKLKNVQALAVPVTPTPPTTSTFAFGMFSFEVENIGGLGQAITLTMTFHNDAKVDSYWKLQDGAWYNFYFDGTTGVIAGAGVITIYLKDGAHGDDVSTPDGKIIDPGAPAIGPSTYLPLIIKNSN